MQELGGLHQQLRGLQEQLHDSSQEVLRLEADASALDSKAVQLQAQLEEAQTSHQDALRHLQVCVFPHSCLSAATCYIIACFIMYDLIRALHFDVTSFMTCWFSSL